MASIESKGLRPGPEETTTAAGRGAGTGATAGRPAAGAAAPALGAGAAACAGAAVAVDKAGAGAAAEAAVGPPGGNVGNFIVGAAEGFGGRLIRTVSFLGWTLPVSFFGGTAPLGTLGRFSAILRCGLKKQMNRFHTGLPWKPGPSRSCFYLDSSFVGFLGNKVRVSPGGVKLYSLLPHQNSRRLSSPNSRQK